MPLFKTFFKFVFCDIQAPSSFFSSLHQEINKIRTRHARMHGGIHVSFWLNIGAQAALWVEALSWWRNSRKLLRNLFKSSTDFVVTLFCSTCVQSNSCFHEFGSQPSHLQNSLNSATSQSQNVFNGPAQSFRMISGSFQLVHQFGPWNADQSEVRYQLTYLLNREKLSNTCLWFSNTHFTKK